MGQKSRKNYSKHGLYLASLRKVYYMCLHLNVIQSENTPYAYIDAHNNDRAKSESCQRSLGLVGK